MKAMVYTQFGPPTEVLALQEVEKPAPQAQEVLVEVHAAAVVYADWAFVRGQPAMVRLMGAGLSKPNHPILGAEIAGRVAAVGEGITQFQPGDEVYGDIAECGFGGYAEYVAVPESALAPKPANLTFKQAAAVPQSGVVALQGLRDKGQVQPGQQALIAGASGGIGTFAVQLAKVFGAEVTGVCSTRNMELVESLGADHVIDYTQEDFAQGGPRFDLIVATAGYRSVFDYARALKPGGTCVVTGGAMKQVFEPMYLGPWVALTSKKKMASLSAGPSQQDLIFMKDLLEAGKIMPVIDTCYPFNETAEALRHYGQGHSRGKVVISVVAAEQSPSDGEP
jgi:NADPH:quinone reductase-like Zn-dependent oxidoreductase